MSKSISQAYTPGLQVSEKTTVTRRRELPLAGKALVSVGDKVKADTKVLEAQLPGDLQIIRLADRMGFTPEEVIRNLQIKTGAELKAGQAICEIKTFFGFFSSKVAADKDGRVEFITESNAHLGLREPPSALYVNAYITGTVSNVEDGKSVSIQSEAALIQGIFGVGGERFGKIITLDIAAGDTVTTNVLEKIDQLEGSVLIGGAAFHHDALKLASAAGVSAIVTGSINALTLREYVGYDIGVSITGDEDVPFSLIITEGFGKLPISEHVLNLAKKLNAKLASVNGATQVRAGAMRPEIIVSLEDKILAQQDENPVQQNLLQVGSRIRVIRVPYFGEFGHVSDLPSQPVQIATGAKVRVLKVRLDSQKEVLIPRSNVELIAK